METMETTTSTGPSPELQAILDQYRPLAAQLGQIIYEFEGKKANILDRMARLNEQARALETKTEAAQ